MQSKLHKGKFIDIKIQIKEKIRTLTFQFKTLENKEQSKPQASIRKKLMVRVGNNEIQKKKTNEKGTKQNSVRWKDQQN